MGYGCGGFTAFFVGPLITDDPTIPAEHKTPQWWADRAAREWSLLGAKELSEKLLPFFIEFNRMCEAEKARKETDDAKTAIEARTAPKPLKGSTAPEK